MTEITINRTCAMLDRCEQFTSGRVGARIKFSFSSEWAGLSKTAVFTNGDTTIDVLNVADEITIPHEVLAISGKKLKVGVYGFTVDDHGNIEIAIPTVYADLGKVVKGADPSGDVSADPTLPVWAQIQGIIGNLNDLDTEAKDTLVAAINEAARSGGGGSTVELDTTLSEAGKAADAKAVGDALAGKQDKLIAGDNITIAADGKTISATGGISATARELLITVLRNGVYSSDQSANITALEAALGGSGGGDTPVVNLFDKNTMAIANTYITANGSRSKNEGSYAAIIPVEPNVTYAIQFGVINPSFAQYLGSIALWNADQEFIGKAIRPTTEFTDSSGTGIGVYIDYDSSGLGYTFTTTADTAFVAFTVKLNDTHNYIDTTMLETGSVCHDYVSYVGEV